MAEPRISKFLQRELFRLALDEIINPDHEMVLIADEIDWRTITKFVEKQFANGVGQPPLQPRLVIVSCPLIKKAPPSVKMVSLGGNLNEQKPKILTTS